MSTPLPGKRPGTYADLEQVPDTKVAELIEGELYVSPRPAPLHALTSSALGGELHNPFGRGRGGPGGWWIFDEPELHFGRNVLVPDLAGWRRDRLPAMPKEAYFTLAPDWVCEVLSPSTASLDRVKKLRVYATERVKHAWIIDSLARTLEVFRLEGVAYLLVGQYVGDELVRAEPFDAIELDLLVLWGEERAAK